MSDEAVLKKHNLGINLDFQFLCCVHHNCGQVLSDNWKRHLSDSHQSLKFISKEEQEEIDNLRPQGNLRPFPPDQPIQGLKIYEGYKCPDCEPRLYFVSSVAAKKHHTKCHKELPYQPTKAKFQETKYQQKRFEVFSSLI